MTVTGRLGRRAVLAATATGTVGAIAGCLSGPSLPDVDVVAGPDGDLVFEPVELTVAAGDTVTWGFASSGHNVSGRPADSDAVELPDGAAPFASFGPDASPVGATVAQGETYEHALETPGRYVYACVPHDDRGMVGTVTVE